MFNREPTTGFEPQPPLDLAAASFDYGLEVSHQSARQLSGYIQAGIDN